MPEKEKVPHKRDFQQYVNKGELSFFAFEFFFDLFNIDGLQHRLGVLNLEGLAPYSCFRLIFAVFSLKSGYCHGFNLLKGAQK